MRGIEVRETLTNEWKKRSVKENPEYAILTAEISKATFGMTPSQYQKFAFKNNNKERKFLPPKFLSFF
jgi:DNA-damage-inducible protein D